MSERYIYIKGGDGRCHILDKESHEMFSLLKIVANEDEAQAECDRLNRKEQEND